MAKFSFTWFKRRSPQFREVSSLILDNADEMCRGGMISRTWVEEDALRSASHVLLMFTQGRTRSARPVLKGFVIAQSRRGSLYIDLVCAKGGGSAAIREVERYAKEIGRSRVSLSALPYVVNFYRKLGYRNAHTNAPGCKESPVVAAAAKKVSGKTFTDPYAPGDYAPFRNFMRVLSTHGLAVDPTCGGADDMSCYVHGYRMVKCITMPTTEDARKSTPKRKTARKSTSKRGSAVARRSTRSTRPKPGTKRKTQASSSGTRLKRPRTRSKSQPVAKRTRRARTA